MVVSSTQQVYKLRYFFDFGSGICLWAVNDAATERFGYQVHSSKLPITSNLMYRIEFVLAWYDTFLDWDNPPQKSPWWVAEGAQFKLVAQDLFDLLQKQLGAEFEIVDESQTKSV